jgi:hypothetical protein
MGELSRRDAALVKSLLKRAERLEAQAEGEVYTRHRRDKLKSAMVYREEADKISKGVRIDG